MEEYYTPTIEEFHIGFEYEYLTVNDDWVTDVFGTAKPIDTEQMPFDIIYDICKEYPAEIRIKYLDREDIVSLGFEHIGSGWFEKDGFRIRKWIEQEVDIYMWTKDDHINEGEIIFSGNIKNKSELKKLLTQLNIK